MGEIKEICVEIESTEIALVDEQRSIDRIDRRRFLQLAESFFAASFIPKGVFDYVDTILEDETDEGVGEAAQSYIAKTPQEAIKVAEALRGRGAHPSNICGPLSIAIMMDWHLSSNGNVTVGENAKLTGIAPSDMWIADPIGDYESTDPKLFENTFPPDKFVSYRVKESTRTLDFDNIPEVGKLLPGDFIYLTGGSFTHFITVSRRDKEGRLYATSNIPTSPKGEFIIDELMLWDPTTKDGYFRNWAKGVGPERASTGREGFIVWRRKAEPEKMLVDPVSEKYRDWFVNVLRGQEKGKWNMLIAELGKGELFEWREGMAYHPASTIKVPIAISMMQTLQEVYSDEIKEKGLKTVLEQRGTSGRTFDQLISAMLVKSEEEATEACVDFTNQSKTLSLEERFAKLGLHETIYLPRRSSQRDLFKCWDGLLSGKLLDTESTQYLLNLLEEYTENDDGLIGTIRKNIPGVRQWNKRGTVMGSGLYTMQDTGVVKIGNKYFYIGIAGTSLAGQEANDAELKSFIEILCKAFVLYAKEREVREKKSRFSNLLQSQ